MLLGVVPQLEAVAGDDLAGVRRVDAGEDPQQGGLPGPVETDEEHALPTLDSELDIDENQVVTERLGEPEGGQR